MLGSEDFRAGLSLNSPSPLGKGWDGGSTKQAQNPHPRSEARDSVRPSPTHPELVEGRGGAIAPDFGLKPPA